MSASNGLSNLQLFSAENVAISPERLKDFVVEEVTAQRSSLQPQQVNESNDDALGFDSLPGEIILEIFSHLTQNQLGRIARVCKNWSMLTKSPVLWKKVNVEIFCSSDKDRNTVVKSFINGLPSCITFIRLDFSEHECLDSMESCEYLDFGELCMKLHQNCPHVEELILVRCAISTDLPEVIHFCTQFLQDLKKLVFDSCQCLNRSKAVELNDDSKIEILCLNCCDFFSRIRFSKLQYLKELRLHLSSDVDDAWFLGDTTFLNHLHVLDLRGTTITAGTFLTIQRHGQNLKELYLCHLYLRDDDLSSNNSAFPHLKTICLRDTLVTCEGVVSLIRSCPSLVNVYVDDLVADSFVKHPFVVANRCKSGIVKSIDWDHNHSVHYLHN